MKRLCYLMLLAMAVVFSMGCENDLSCCKGKSSVKLSEKEKDVIAQFSVIGEQHNQILTDYYELNSGRFVEAVSLHENKFNEYFEVDGETIFITIEEKDSAFRSSSNEVSLVEELDKQGFIYSSAEDYILRVENILEEPSDSLESTQIKILQIEQEAINNLAGDALVQFMSYAETAKYSLSFWYDSYETLEGEKASARFITSLWKKYKKKVAMAAASDAAGAAAGALAGATIGSAIPGVGSATGAVVGAAVAGAASSAEGFKKGKLCVVVPLTKIKKKL